MLEQYQKLLTQNVLCEDKAQHSAVQALAQLSEQLVLVEHDRLNNKKSSFGFFSKKTINKRKPVTRGLYFHGRVGRGKTMLMDLFYENIPLKQKKRIHFHRFMESIHQELKQLSLTKSAIDNPLVHIAKRWSGEISLLCFDEFFVSDIGDAMLLSGLFEELFRSGITLVTTSNCQPEQLYRNGLQRERFLPTINLINQFCQIISIDGDIDHRLTDHKHHYRNYYFSHQNGEQLLADRFVQLSAVNTNDVNEARLENNTAISLSFKNDKLECITSKNLSSKSITINHREISYLDKTNKHIWFDFFALCSGPRSQRDYMQLADLFDTILISNVPQFGGKLIPAVFSGVEDSYQRSGVLMGDLRQLDDEARRFIALVDEFYDRKIHLIVCADVDITELYQGQQLSFEFQRCQSRLFEMQSY
ncbi:MAG: cell division protein ZapE [Colwellia sp.]|nr:cell division protein ZapE [Colwellia sp.]